MKKNSQILWVRWLIVSAVCNLLMNPTPAVGKDVRSSTFVGNGGDVQDLDLLVTLAVIKTIGKRVSKTASPTLCTCSDEWQDNDICRVLRQMSSEEVKACRQILQTQGDDLAALADPSSPVQYDWSDEGLAVQSGAQSQRGRPVDAVTQSETQRIIINRDRFQNMPASYRVALLTHEIFHLIKFEGRLVTDEQPAQPFSSGRRMLNALGAAVAMEANEQEVFDDFQALKNVSRASKNHRVYIATRSIRHQDKSSAQLLKGSVSVATGLGYVYERGSFGLGLALETIHDDASKSGVSIDERQTIYHLDVQYRFFPVRRQLSRWNEMYFSIGLDAGYGSTDYKASTQHVEMADRSPLTGAGALLRLNIPIVQSFWIVTGAEYRQVRYEYKKLRIKTIENQSVYSIGGGYGF